MVRCLIGCFIKIIGYVDIIKIYILDNLISY